MALNVTLRDLSRGGCQVHDRGGRLHVEQFLTIRIGPIGPIDARVRWLKGRVAGICFDQPLADPVLDHIRVIAEQNDKDSEKAELSESEVEQLLPFNTKRLDLLSRERRYNEVVNALEINEAGEEVLLGLDSKESDFLIRWRREIRAEREARPSHRSDKAQADRLEELHDQMRKGRPGL